MNDTTINYYNENALKYFESTINGDMNEAYKYFLRDIPKGGYILDYGCGSGRDTKYFIDNGYIVDAIDGSSELCKLASSYTGINVKCMDFMDLNVNNIYDGIWACSSIIHVPKKELITILKKMSSAIRKNGYIYTCFKNGNDEEFVNGRYFNYLDYDSFINNLEYVSELELITYFASSSTTNSLESRKWNNFILRKKQNT